jgi:hypothetical protein
MLSKHSEPSKKLQERRAIYERMTENYFVEQKLLCAACAAAQLGGAIAPRGAAGEPAAEAAAQRRRGAAAEAEAAGAGGLPALRVRRSRQRPQVLARHWPGPGPAGRRRTSARSVRIDVSCAMS